MGRRGDLTVLSARALPRARRVALPRRQASAGPGTAKMPPCPGCLRCVPATAPLRGPCPSSSPSLLFRRRGPGQTAETAPGGSGRRAPAPGAVPAALVAPGLVAPGLVAPGLVAPGLVAPGLVAPGSQPAGKTPTEAGKEVRAQRSPVLRSLAIAAVSVAVAGVALGVELDHPGRRAPVASHTTSPSRRPAAPVRSATTSVPAPTTTAAPPASTVPPEPAVLVSANGGTATYQLTSPTASIVVKANGPCWIEVKAGSPTGQVVVEETLSAGQRSSVTGPAWIRLGDPPHVAVTVDGTPMSVARRGTAVPLRPPVHTGGPGSEACLARLGAGRPQVGTSTRAARASVGPPDGGGPGS